MGTKEMIKESKVLNSLNNGGTSPAATGLHSQHTEQTWIHQASVRCVCVCACVCVHWMFT